MPKFVMTEVVGSSTITVRLGAGAGAANNMDDVTERGKFVKLGAESRYVLAVLGDEIEARIESINAATSDGFSIGAVSDSDTDFMRVTFDGLQATPGTGLVTIGAYVLVGTPVARLTQLTAPARVVSATDQAAAKVGPFSWRVVSLGASGTGNGAVGTTGLIQRCA